MKKIGCALFVSVAVFCGCSTQNNEMLLSTDHFSLGVSASGFVTHIGDKRSDTEFLAPDTLAPLLSIRVNGTIHHPESARFQSDKKQLQLTFGNGIEATIQTTSSKSHITMELVAMTRAADIELVIWGPYPTIISKTIGETVGVVRDGNFAIGIQSLNPKTLGGYPWQENDCMPQIDIFEQDDYSDLSEKGKRYVLYRVEAAKPTRYGSSLQAFTRNRNSERIIANLNHERYTAPAVDDGGIIGSKIALFGSPEKSALETIGEIELAEGLPHPQIDGEWGKTARSASAAYMILDFDSKTISKAIDITRKAGLRYLYHSDPFENWGHFDLKKSAFPEGVASLKRAVELAEKQGIMVGVHTLSNFITTNDPWVTPIPDARLAKVGSSTLAGAINSRQTTISVADPGFFNQFKNNHLRTVQVGDELIRYGSVSESAPWHLRDCQRGAFGTKATAHKAGETISKLVDHGYKVFLTNPELSVAMAKNIANLFNQAGLRQISFDGLEGNRSTGMGNYGEILFTQTWFDNINPSVRRHYIADASRTSHYFWHMYTRMNWGEPWYAGFRESQTEYRLKNQKYFRRNYMPGMLGWFKMTPETSIEDIEWMLARSAAFNAGYAFVASYEALEKNGHTDAILERLGSWEKARMAGAFSDEQQQRMEDIKNEFQLEGAGDGTWQLRQIHSFKFKHEKKVRQPGEPLYSTFNFHNPVTTQALNFILTAVGADVRDAKIELNNYKNFVLPVTLKEGESIKYAGGNEAIIFSRTWQEKRRIPIDAALLQVAKGDHSLTFDCQFSEGKDAVAKLEIRIVGEAEKLKSAKKK